MKLDASHQILTREYDLSSTGSKGGKLEHYHSAGVHVADIGGDPRRVDDIVEVQHGDERVHLHEHRQRLTDPARRAQDRDLEPRRAALGAARRGPQRRRRRAPPPSATTRNNSSRFSSRSTQAGERSRSNRGAHLRVEVRGDAGHAVRGGAGVGLHGGDRSLAVAADDGAGGDWRAGRGSRVEF